LTRGYSQTFFGGDRYRHAQILPKTSKDDWSEEKYRCPKIPRLCEARAANMTLDRSVEVVCRQSDEIVTPGTEPGRCGESLECPD
jgi:hypothetical protein